MTQFLTNLAAGHQALTEITATRKHPLGTIATYNDSETNFAGEVIYLKGVISTVAGSWVTYNPDDFSTTLAVANGIGPVAIAVGANVADRYGWYYISGKVSAGKCLTGYADNGAVFLTSTAGSVDDTSVAGDLVYNAKGASSVSGLAAEFEIARPFVTDRPGAKY